VTKLLAFCACVAALVALLVWPGNADPARYARAQGSDKVSADDVDAALRRSGLTPVGPIRRGHDVFVTHAIDMRGTKLRVVADALFGDIVSVAPVQPGPIYAAHGGAGPRIIHIPQRDDVGAAPRTDDDHASATVEDEAPAAAPPRRDTPHTRDLNREPRRKPYQQSHRPEPASRVSARAVPPAAAPVEVKAKRSVLAIPAEPVQPKSEALPPPPATPRWQSAEKFDAPKDAVTTPPSAAAEDAHASADVPSAVAPIASDNDMPPEGITADPLPAR
jgi:hypothetical protein